MRVKVRIEFPAGIVAEARGQEIAGDALGVRPGFSHASFCERFELIHRSLDRLIVQPYNTIILMKGDDRHALRRRDHEVKKDAPIRDCIPSSVIADRVHSLA